MSGNLKKTQNCSSKVCKAKNQKVIRQIKQYLVDMLFFLFPLLWNLLLLQISFT